MITDASNITVAESRIPNCKKIAFDTTAIHWELDVPVGREYEFQEVNALVHLLQQAYADSSSKCLESLHFFNELPIPAFFSQLTTAYVPEYTHEQDDEPQYKQIAEELFQQMRNSPFAQQFNPQLFLNTLLSYYTYAVLVARGELSKEDLLTVLKTYSTASQGILQPISGAELMVSPLSDDTLAKCQWNKNVAYLVELAYNWANGCCVLSKPEFKKYPYNESNLSETISPEKETALSVGRKFLDSVNNIYKLNLLPQDDPLLRQIIADYTAFCQGINTTFKYDEKVKKRLQCNFSAICQLYGSAAVQAFISTQLDPITKHYTTQSGSFEGKWAFPFSEMVAAIRLYEKGLTSLAKLAFAREKAQQILIPVLHANTPSKVGHWSLLILDYLPEQNAYRISRVDSLNQLREAHHTMLQQYQNILTQLGINTVLGAGMSLYLQGAYPTCGVMTIEAMELYLDPSRHQELHQLRDKPQQLWDNQILCLTGMQIIKLYQLYCANQIEGELQALFDIDDPDTVALLLAEGSLVAGNITMTNLLARPGQPPVATQPIQSKLPAQFYREEKLQSPSPTTTYATQPVSSVLPQPDQQRQNSPSAVNPITKQQRNLSKEEWDTIDHLVDEYTKELAETSFFNPHKKRKQQKLEFWSQVKNGQIVPGDVFARSRDAKWKEVAKGERSRDLIHKIAGFK